MAERMTPMTAPAVARGSSATAFGGRRCWTWTVAALLLLALAAGFFRWSSGHLAEARQELELARQGLAEARQQELQTIDHAKRAQLALGLMRDAGTAGLSQAAWAERRFNIKQVNMSRESANALLKEMVRSPDRLFGAEEFELSVRDAKEGLFSSVVDPGSMVQVSVRGSLMFRTGGRS